MAITRNTRLIACLVLSFLAVTMVFSFPISGIAAEEEQPAEAKADMPEPDVLIWIYATDPAMTFVSMTYPKQIDRSEAEVDLGSILKETGWTATNISISDESVTPSGDRPMTSVEFATGAMLQPGTDILPVEPIVKAMKERTQMRVIFALPQGASVRGVGDFENRYVDIRLIRGTDTYQYSITVKDSTFDALNLPVAQPGQPDIPAEGGRNLMKTVFVVALALLLAVVGYIITSRAVARSGRDRG